jgi:hypothetical protein
VRPQFLKKQTFYYKGLHCVKITSNIMDHISNNTLQVWGGTAAVWAAGYGLFVSTFGSADGAHVLSEGQVRKMAASDAGNSKAAKKASPSKKTTPVDEDRQKAIAFAAEALSPVSPKKKSASPSRKRAESPAASPAAKKGSANKRAESPAPAKKASANKSKSTAAKFSQGDHVDVEAHTTPGSKPRDGGRGKITKVNSDGTYEITYVLGGKETSVSGKLCSEVDFAATETKRQSRPSQKRISADADEQVTSERPKRSRR